MDLSGGFNVTSLALQVLEWQRSQRANAEQRGYVTTMLGRRRYLPDASGSNSKAKGHALRAAINTPIQGSAADVATAAMISISKCPDLAAMGWKLLLQVQFYGPSECSASSPVRMQSQAALAANSTSRNAPTG